MTKDKTPIRRLITPTTTDGGSRSCTVELDQVGSFHRIKTSGYINKKGGARVARHGHHLLDEGHRFFIIDLTETRTINSIGISYFIELMERVAEVSGRIQLCGLNDTVSKTFEIMGLADPTRVSATAARAAKKLASACAEDLK